MALDSETLGSLRIDRSVQPSGGAGRTILIWVVAISVVAGAAAGLWMWLGGKTTEVTTVVAEQESSGPSMGSSVLNASGYVVARRLSTVASKVTGRVLEIYVEEGMTVEKDQVVASLDPVNTQTMLTM